VKKRAIRKGLKGTLAVCLSCLDKQREIDRLQDEVKRLKDLVRRQDRTIKEGQFGSSTPSSKIPFKQNSLEENQKKIEEAKKAETEYMNQVNQVESNLVDALSQLDGLNNKLGEAKSELDRITIELVINDKELSETEKEVNDCLAQHQIRPAALLDREVERPPVWAAIEVPDHPTAQARLGHAVRGSRSGLSV